VTYEGRNITAELLPMITALTFTDKLKGEADEVVIDMHDIDGVWKNTWYPAKGDRLEVGIGYEGEPLLDCGKFQVDEIEFSGPPDTVQLRALSMAVNSTLRTKRSSAHEGIPLREIAQTIADRNGLEIVDGTVRTDAGAVAFTQEREILTAIAAELLAGQTLSEVAYRIGVLGIVVRLDAVIITLRQKGKTKDAAELVEYRKMLSSSTRWERYIKHMAAQISAMVARLKDYSYSRTTSKLDGIRVGRVTQKNETDLEFLARIAATYGLIFSVKDTKLAFTATADIESGTEVLTLGRADLISYSFRDKTAGVYKRARVAYHDPDSKALTESTIEAGEEDGVEYDQTTGGDDLEIEERAEGRAAAETKAKAALSAANSEAKTATITTDGNTYLVSGNNLRIDGFGVLSGRFTIKESTHTFTSSGYTTECQLKKMAN